MRSRDRVFHICLAGPRVSGDWLLIQALRAQHQVTLMERVRLLSRNAILTGVDVLVLDCSQGLRPMNFLKRHFPDLCVVLVDGGLTRRQIAVAYQKGVKDYFPHPYDVKLLVERLHFLGSRFGNHARKAT